MKMVVCGKGGSGKSTVTALLAQEWALTGKNVMIVDTDESNIGLHRFLGVNPPTDLMDQMGGKKEVMEKMMSAMKNPDGFDNMKLFDKEWNIADIPSPCVSENQNVKLVSVGKVHHAGEGCACPMGFVAKQFLKNLKLIKLLPDSHEALMKRCVAANSMLLFQVNFIQLVTVHSLFFFSIFLFRISAILRLML